MEEEQRDKILSSLLLDEAEGISQQVVAWRREFHQFPELAFDERVTAARIVQILSDLDGMEVTTGLGTSTSVVGLLRGDLRKPALMLRSDMDALALEEGTDLPFASCMPGLMHGCGHDAHMATLLGAATLLSRHQEDLARPVVFVFQPAEEGMGGAKSMVEGGLIKRFDVGMALGFHYWPHYSYGKLFTRQGPMTAISDQMHVEMQGVGGHAAEPHLVVDPIIAMAQLLLATQSLTNREIDPMKAAVVSFGRIEAGEAYNVIPERVHLWGTVRAFDADTRDYLRKRLEEVVPTISKAFRVMGTMEYMPYCPPTINDEALTERILELSKSLLGEENVMVMERPLFAGEDFAFYSQLVPSCFCIMGTGVEYGLHHPKYDIPEDLFPLAVAWEAYMGLLLDLQEVR